MAITLLLNAALAFAMYVAAWHYLPQFDKVAAQEILNVAGIALYFVETFLIVLAVYFWLKNKSIELWVTPSELHYFDPTFSDFGWTVAVKDIIEIDQYTDSQQNFVNTFVVLRSGERMQLNYNNFSIDRRAFFDALKKANAAIKLPNNPYRYKTRKPAWALKWLNRNR